MNSLSTTSTMARPMRVAAAALAGALAFSFGVSALPAQADEPADVTASSAGTKHVGHSTNAWGSLSGLEGQVTVSTQVLVNGAWSTSQKTTTSDASYVLPLTYGAHSAGTNTWRVVAVDADETAVSDTFTLTRVHPPAVSASSAGTKNVRETTNVWGSVSGFSGSVTVSTQVRIGSSWSTSQKTTTGGSYVLPLTYGANTAGTYTWRVVATDGRTTAVSPSFTLRRVETGIPDSVWAALAQCESGGNPRIVSSNGLYYGLYQFSLTTWRSVGGTGLPSQATPEEQTNRARILQARSGWGQWPYCSSKLGLR